MKRAIMVGTVALGSMWTAAAGPAQAGDSAKPYVIAVRDGADPAAVATANGVAPTLVFDEIGGFAADLTDKQVKKLRSDGAVESVEVDAVVARIEPGRTGAIPPGHPAQLTSWGQDRMGLLESPTAKVDGIDERIDVDIAILDGGIYANHPDLNVAGGFNCLRGNKHDWDDRDGHGTLVAGFAAAIDNEFGYVGMAPGARVWAVRVARPDGVIPDSALLCGMNWVIKHADEIEVANMSLGDDLRAYAPDVAAKRLSPCGGRPKYNQHEAICKMVQRGVTVAVAAGNESMDASMMIPAAYPEVITVSAFTETDGLPGGLGPNSRCAPNAHVPDDHLSDFSNFGAPVDIAAPGECVSSTYFDGFYAAGSGTSFATPHVAGAAALYISKHPNASPAKVQAALVANGEQGVVLGDPDSYPEPLLNVSRI